MDRKDEFSVAAGGYTPQQAAFMEKLREHRDIIDLAMEYAAVILPYKPQMLGGIDLATMAGTDIGKLLMQPEAREIAAAVMLDRSFKAYPLAPGSHQDLMGRYENTQFGDMSFLWGQHKAALAGFRAAAEQDGQVSLEETLDFLALHRQYNVDLAKLPEPPLALQKAAEHMLHKHLTDVKPEWIAGLAGHMEQGLIALEQAAQHDKPAHSSGFIAPVLER